MKRLTTRSTAHKRQSRPDRAPALATAIVQRALDPVNLFFEDILNGQQFSQLEAQIGVEPTPNNDQMTMLRDRVQAGLTSDGCEALRCLEDAYVARETVRTEAALLIGIELGRRSPAGGAR